MTEVTTGGTVVATYTYDALNNRIGVDDNGTQTWTVYDGTHPYADFNGSGSLKVRYQYGPGVVDGAVVDELLARTSASGSTAWYLTDKLGSVRDIVSSSASELDHVVYDSFGNIVTETNAANGDRFKFAGMEYDAVTEKYYDLARNYDSMAGRFASQDPKGFAAGDSNLYCYTHNQPTDLVDRSGLQSDSSSSQGESPQTAAASPQSQSKAERHATLNIVLPPLSRIQPPDFPKTSPYYNYEDMIKTPVDVLRQIKFEADAQNKRMMDEIQLAFNRLREIRADLVKVSVQLGIVTISKEITFFSRWRNAIGGLVSKDAKKKGPGAGR